MKNISIFGAGAWGTALAVAIANNKHNVNLWALENEVVEAITNQHENIPYLKGVRLDKNITATSSYEIAAKSDIILLVPPAQHLRAVLNNVKAYLSPNTPVVICSKGIEIISLKLLSEIAQEIIPNNPIAILSGPTFAREVALNLPTAITLATNDQELGKTIINTIGTKTLRPYLSDDIIGVEICGSVKNVIAIACGIVTGLNLGDNARAALMTRGLAEITRLALKMGAKKETLMGLSGLGDLALTCNNMQSRNFSLGAMLGQGQPLEDILSHRTAVTEGVDTATALYKLANQHNIEMPISFAVYNILQNRANVVKVMEELLSRPFKSEHL